MIPGDSNKNPESYLANLDEEDRRLFDEEFIHKSIGEPDDDEGLYHEQLLHNACQEVWDDLLEENVLDDLDESNFPGAIWRLILNHSTGASSSTGCYFSFVTGGHTVTLLTAE